MEDTTKKCDMCKMSLICKVYDSTCSLVACVNLTLTVPVPDWFEFREELFATAAKRCSYFRLRDKKE